MAGAMANCGVRLGNSTGINIKEGVSKSNADSRRRGIGVRASTASSISVSPPSDPYSTLGLSHSASKKEIKIAYRRLALQYHPDVCRGDHCAMKFMQITAAYEHVLDGGNSTYPDVTDDDCLDGFMGAEDDSWDEWEEWMGWEGAGTYDYTTHINDSC